MLEGRVKPLVQHQGKRVVDRCICTYQVQRPLDAKTHLQTTEQTIGYRQNWTKNRDSLVNVDTWQRVGNFRQVSSKNDGSAAGPLKNAVLP